MADEPADFVPGCPSPDLLDIAFLFNTHEYVRDALRHALHEVSYPRDEIQSLASGPGLPDQVREAYGRMVALLTKVEQAIISGKKEFDELQHEIYSSDLWRRYVDLPSPAPSPALVSAAEEAICKINEAQLRVADVVKSMRGALLEHADQGLFDWTSQCECEFNIIMKGGAARPFYETCDFGDGDNSEARRFRVRPALDPMPGDSFFDPSSNWNVFEHSDDHPLRHGHHGYLVHCLIEHHHFPWELLPHIQEVEVQIEFSDIVAAWEAPVVGSGDKADRQQP